MSAASDFKIAQSYEYEGDDWWSWSVWIEGDDDSLDQIREVEYTLHPTFLKPVRVVKTRRNQFKLSTEGWGGFPIYANVVKKDGKVRHLKHQLSLYYPAKVRE